MSSINTLKHFRSSYEVSRNKLGAGVHGQVYMAIDQSIRRQLACKLVDLRKIRAEQEGKVQSSYTFKNAQVKYGSTSSTLKAMAIVQKGAIERKVTEVKIKQLREVEILKDLIHVEPHETSDEILSLLTVSLAKHYPFRESVLHR